MIYFLILTAITVSIDSLVCGFSLAFSCKKKLEVVSIVALTVFVMCLITNYATVVFQDKLNEKTACLGGLLLIIIGIYNLITANKNKTDLKTKKPLIQSLITGFAVGLDGALANLSLSLMGLNAFYVPLTIAVTHAIAIYLGVSLANTRLAHTFAKIEFLPPLILILLGGYKLLGLFI